MTNIVAAIILSTNLWVTYERSEMQASTINETNTVVFEHQRFCKCEVEVAGKKMKILETYFSDKDPKRSLQYETKQK